MLLMNYVIRHMLQTEWSLLEDFLYEAIYIPEGFEGTLQRSVIFDDPNCRACFEGFGSLPDDRAVVAVVDDKVIGACWVRTTDEYGHIDDDMPSFAVSLYEPYRNRGIGTRMMRELLDELRDAGYARASLSVQKDNPALRLYERLGFRIVGDGFDDTEWMMVCRLDRPVGLEFQKLTYDDVPTFAEMRVMQLLEEGARETVDLRPALYDHYARHLADGSFFACLALDEGRIIATGGISVVEKPPYFGCPTGRIGLISSMYTAPAYRRQGIARDVLCRVVEEARRQSCGVVQITASDAGVPLYQSVGFTPNANFLQLSLGNWHRKEELGRR